MCLFCFQFKNSILPPPPQTHTGMLEWWDVVLQMRWPGLSFVLLLSTLVCCKTTEFILGFFVSNFNPPPPPRPRNSQLRPVTAKRRSGRSNTRSLFRTSATPRSWLRSRKKGLGGGGVNYGQHITTHGSNLVPCKVCIRRRLSNVRNWQTGGVYSYWTNWMYLAKLFSRSWIKPSLSVPKKIKLLKRNLILLVMTPLTLLSIVFFCWLDAK